MQKRYTIETQKQDPQRKDAVKSEEVMPELIPKTCVCLKTSGKVAFPSLIIRMGVGLVWRSKPVTNSIHRFLSEPALEASVRSHRVSFPNWSEKGH